MKPTFHSDQPIKIYTAMKMTGRMNADVRTEADMLVRTLANYGFVALNPAIEENVPYTNEILSVAQDAPEQLERYWERDKQMIREADLVLDYMTQNSSDGVNKEIAYARFCLWKPVIRVWNGPGGAISRLEDDVVVQTLAEAMHTIGVEWGTTDKLKDWRLGMLGRSLDRWYAYQQTTDERYGIKHSEVLARRHEYLDIRSV